MSSLRPHPVVAVVADGAGISLRYYHGDLKLELQLANATGTEYSLYNGTACQGFRIFEIEYQQSTVFLGRAVGRAPLSFSVNGVIDDRPYDDDSLNDAFWNEGAFYLTSDEYARFFFPSKSLQGTNHHYLFSLSESFPTDFLRIAPAPYLVIVGVSQQNPGMKRRTTTVLTLPK